MNDCVVRRSYTRLLGITEFSCQQEANRLKGRSGAHILLEWMVIDKLKVVLTLIGAYVLILLVLHELVN